VADSLALPMVGLLLVAHAIGLATCALGFFLTSPFVAVALDRPYAAGMGAVEDGLLLPSLRFARIVGPLENILCWACLFLVPHFLEMLFRRGMEILKMTVPFVSQIVRILTLVFWHPLTIVLDPSC
jgi:hypothetical protein